MWGGRARSQDLSRARGRAKAQKSQFWPILGLWGPFWPILGHLGPFWLSLGHFGAFWPVLAHFGPFSPIHELSTPYRAPYMKTTPPTGAWFLSSISLSPSLELYIFVSLNFFQSSWPSWHIYTDARPGPMAYMGRVTPLVGG